ncbi:hypothetical protein BaRGS_00013778 [Batillaria attramentaria]|uniref:Uncharacterized protein n=1 Tax=Batillaria attramentaria TaxID=370345 RepID=A0ABD0L6A1_9CAEN
MLTVHGRVNSLCRRLARYKRFARPNSRQGLAHDTLTRAVIISQLSPLGGVTCRLGDDLSKERLMGKVVERDDTGFPVLSGCCLIGVGCLPAVKSGVSRADPEIPHHQAFRFRRCHSSLPLHNFIC